jgi:hypothetical protein
LSILLRRPWWQVGDWAMETPGKRAGQGDWRCWDQSGVTASRYLPGDDDCHSPLRGRRPLGIGRAPGPGADGPFHDRQCTLRFPAHNQDFGLDQYTPAPDRVATGGFRQANGETTEISVLLVQVAVEMPGDFTEEEVSATDDDAAFRAAHALLHEAADIGRELVSSFVLAVRTQHRQSWLAPENVPPRVVWLSDLRDGSGRRLPVGYADPMTVKTMGGMAGLTATDVGNWVDQLQQDTKPPFADLLLADAQFHAWHAAHPNPHLGLMLAAIAAEVKIKETLVALATPGQRPVLDLVLENPRDWSMAAASLFDKALKAVAGVSLREEAKPLYKAVDDLFVHRNRFAHRGDVTLDESLVRKDLQAARRVFDWLDDKLSQLLTPRPKLSPALRTAPGVVDGPLLLGLLQVPVSLKPPSGRGLLVAALGPVSGPARGRPAAHRWRRAALAGHRHHFGCGSASRATCRDRIVPQRVAASHHG